MFQISHFLLAASCALATAARAPAAVLGSPSQAAVDAAIQCPLIAYAASYPGGAYTNGAFFGGAPVTLAVAAYAGNATADARLLQQIRYTLTPGKEPCANGGYPAQHERHVTGMFAIVKRTPRIWDQLTTAEKAKIDLVMKSTFVASAFTTSDNNPYLASQRTLDADFNLGRDWNPNYREGMLGGVLVGMIYFGGPAAAEAMLNNYDHAEFVAQLAAAGMPNAHATFNFKAANPTSAAPAGTDIQDGVRNYRYHSMALSDYNGLYLSLATDTYGKYVNSGLNGGAGIGGAGKIVSGAENLPNQGAAGMLKEFDSGDGGGPRSSVFYAYDGYRPHQTNQLVMIVGGYWEKGGAVASAVVPRMLVGNADLFYKISKGYIDYSSGRNRGLIDEAYMEEHAIRYVRPLWEEVLKPYHQAADTDTEMDGDGDGTPDATERLLGLDPASAASFFSASLAGGTLQWPSAAGLSFTVERSADPSALVWETIAIVPGSPGSAIFTDPSPPAGHALYRVSFRP